MKLEGNGPALPVLIVCGLLLGAVHTQAAITVKVDSTKQWVGWLNVWETNGTRLVSGNSWSTSDLRAEFIPSGSPTGWPLNRYVVLRPNISTYNPSDAFWNFPNGSPNKILEAIFYVDVYTAFAGQTVTFTGSVTSNNIAAVTGAPASGWQVIAFVKEFDASYGFLGQTTVPLRANTPFSVSRAIGSGRVCQYGFSVIGPNTAPESTAALTSATIRVEDPDPLITLQPFGSTISRGETITIRVGAMGGSALNYRWRRDAVILSDGGNISGATTANLTISNAQFSDSGQYIVRVGDAAGSVVSQAARLTVLCTLTNETQPFAIYRFGRNTNGFFMLNWESCSSHLYEVQSSEEPSVSSSWIARDLMIGKDGTTSWTSSPPPGADQQFYRVQRYSFESDQDGDGLSNKAEFDRGTNLHSRDSDGDAIPDGWEAQYGLNPLDPKDIYLDLDNDGYSNLQEYQLRTRPNASYSHPADPPHSLVGWWKLDEGTGTNVFDSSLNGHHAYLMGQNPTGSWTAGYFSSAVTLGGPANNWIHVPYQAGLAYTQEITLMGWVKPFGRGSLIGNWDSGVEASGNYRVQFGPDDIEVWFSAAGVGSYSTLRFNPKWSTNQWHHLAVSYSKAASVDIFVDGEWRTNTVVAGPFLSVANPILIGFPGLTDAYSLDDVRLYNRALSTNEIAAFSRGDGLPENMIVGQTATLRAFGASDRDICQWTVLAGQGFFTNTANLTTDFRPSWPGAVTIQAVCASSGVLRTNLLQTLVMFPSLSPIAEWNEPDVQLHNNCYNFATDIRTDTMAQPGGPPYYYAYTCDLQRSAAISDGLQADVNLSDLCHTSGLPNGHIVALLVWSPNVDFHWVRLEANGMWSSKAGTFPATTLDNAGQPITDPRTANFGYYQFCGFFWVGPDVNILHFPQ